MRDKTDFLIVGAGLFGATCAYLLDKRGFNVNIIERSRIAGTCYDVKQRGIMVHKHGAHIFHTKSETVWDFVRQFADFNNYKHRVLCYLEGQYIQFPPNKTTYRQLATDSRDVVYAKLFRGYTLKAWNTKQTDAIARIPFRDTEDEDYFEDKYQGIPREGYTKMIQNMLGNIPIEYRCFTLEDTQEGKRVIYSGSVDELFDYRFGKLEYMSREFIEKEFAGTFQEVACVNYPSLDVPYVRIIEHKHFSESYFSKTVISYEYPRVFDGTNERYYPVLTERNKSLYRKYKRALPDNVIVGGRLGDYRYYDMDQVINNAIELCQTF